MTQVQWDTCVLFGEAAGGQKLSYQGNSNGARYYSQQMNQVPGVSCWVSQVLLQTLWTVLSKLLLTRREAQTPNVAVDSCLQRATRRCFNLKLNSALGHKISMKKFPKIIFIEMILCFSPALCNSSKSSLASKAVCCPATNPSRSAPVLNYSQTLQVNLQYLFFFFEHQVQTNLCLLTKPLHQCHISQPPPICKLMLSSEVIDSQSRFGITILCPSQCRGVFICCLNCLIYWNFSKTVSKI